MSLDLIRPWRRLCAALAALHSARVCRLPCLPFGASAAEGLPTCVCRPAMPCAALLLGWRVVGEGGTDGRSFFFVGLVGPFPASAPVPRCAPAQMHTPHAPHTRRNQKRTQAQCRPGLLSFLLPVASTPSFQRPSKAASALNVQSSSARPWPELPLPSISVLPD